MQGRFDCLEMRRKRDVNTRKLTVKTNVWKRHPYIRSCKKSRSYLLDGHAVKCQNKR